MEVSGPLKCQWLFKSANKVDATGGKCPPTLCPPACPRHGVDLATRCVALHVDGMLAPNMECTDDQKARHYGYN